MLTAMVDGGAVRQLGLTGGRPLLGAVSPACSLPLHLFSLPSWTPSLVASLLPVVYFLFCRSAEEMGGEYP